MDACKLVEVPVECPTCHAGRSLYGGHGGQIVRFRWRSYQCGRKWHPQHGWRSSLGTCCLERRYRDALLLILHSKGKNAAAAEIAKVALCDPAEEGRGR